jgi:hypothetical protein
MRGQFQEALDYFVEGEKLQPNNPTAHNWLRRTYEELQDFNDAVEEFKVIDHLAKEESKERTALYDSMLRAARASGPSGYWHERLATPGLEVDHPLEMAVIWMHLTNKVQSYAYLEKACNPGEKEGLMVYPCWDHRDPAFQAIARKAKLIK